MADHSLKLTFPCDPSVLRVVRLAASSMAMDVGFGINDLDDLSLAVDELTSALLESATGEVEVRIVVDDFGVTVTGVATDSTGVELNDLAVSILNAATDRFTVREDGYSMVKLRADVG